MLKRRARSMRLWVSQLGSRLHLRVATLAHARLRSPAGYAAATVRPGQQCHALSRVCRLTRQSTGRAPASRGTPVISNVGHHGRFVVHSLRSALNQMHSFCAASFHSGKSTKCLARLPVLVTWFRESFAGSFFSLSALGLSCSLRLVAFAVVAASHLVGSLLALRAAVLHLVASPLVLSFSPACLLRSPSASCQPKSRLSLGRLYQVACYRLRWHTSATVVPCLRVLPNPSIERTCPGKPGQASHLKR